jgi:hypothetical protein
MVRFLWSDSQCETTTTNSYTYIRVGGTVAAMVEGEVFDNDDLLP